MRKIVKKEPNTRKGRPAKATTASSTKQSTTKRGRSVKATAASSKKKQSTTKIGRPARSTTASSTKQSTTLPVSIPAISPASQSPVGRQLFSSLSPEVEAETNPLPEIEADTNRLPEIEGTAEEKLTASLDALKMTNQAEKSSFYRSGTHFASNLKTILKFLCSSIESQGGHGGKKGEPAALYVCGVPGIGKTSGVKWCCTKAIEETTSNSDYEGPTPTVVHINAGHMSSASNPEAILLEEMARALGMNAPDKQKKNNILTHIKKKQMILLVVDEIDLLVSASSQMVEGRRPGTEGVIQTLLGYAQDETMPLALIGISNSSANDKYHRLKEIGKVRPAFGQLLQ
jgi:Cdc6-like AAA superfamily ATPase